MKTYTVEEVFEILKNGKETIYFAIVNDKKETLVNCDTGNLQCAFYIEPEDIEGARDGLYGVYGDCVRQDDQLDSRYDSDEEILQGLKDLKSYGDFVLSAAGGKSMFESTGRFYKRY